MIQTIIKRYNIINNLQCLSQPTPLAPFARKRTTINLVSISRVNIVNMMRVHNVVKHIFYRNLYQSV